MLLWKSADVSAKTTAHIPAKSFIPSSRAPLKALAVALTRPASIVEVNRQAEGTSELNRRLGDGVKGAGALERCGAAGDYG